MVPARVWALTLFILVFSIAISIFKDIPDLEGDRRFGIMTFTVKLGQVAVFNVARWILTICYVGMMGAALWLPGVHHGFLLLSHGLVLGCFLYLSQRVAMTGDLADVTDGAASHPSKTVTYPAFYQFIWKLFFVEYILFPISCCLAIG